MAEKEIILRSIDFDMEGTPERVTLTLPVDTLARVTRVLGKLSPAATNPPEDGPACSDFYRAATGELFNRWWDDGLEGYFG